MCDTTGTEVIPMEDVVQITTESVPSTHQNEDYSSALESWVVDMLKFESNSPVRIFKPKGVNSPDCTLNENDFSLIIMTTSQCEFFANFGSNCVVCVDTVDQGEMTYVILVNSRGECFPVAFMLSNRCDTETLQLFFETIKITTRQITPQAFISPDLEMYYSAWASVMDNVSRKFLNCSSTNTAIQNSIDLIADKRVQDRVLKEIVNLINETDETVFCMEMANIVTNVLSDTETQKFGQFFEENYAQRKELWASCYRRALHPEADRNLEILRKRLNKFYRTGKTERRLDKCITECIKVFSAKFIQFKGHINRDQLADATSPMRKMHAASISGKSEVRKVSAACWKIKMRREENYFYVEDKKGIVCCDVCCCDCKICIHMFSCTCEDYLVKCTICKHIHLLNHVLKSKKKKNNHEKTITHKIRNLQETERLPLTENEKKLRNDLLRCINLTQNIFNKDRLVQVEGHIKAALHILRGFPLPSKTEF